MYIVTKNHAKFDVESQKYKREAVEFLGWDETASLSVYDHYFIENTTREQYNQIINEIFDAKKCIIYTQLPEFDEQNAFRFRQVTGQYNEHEQMTQELINHLLGLEDVVVHHSKIVVVKQATAENLKDLKNYLLNPVEYTEISLDAKPFEIHDSETTELEPVAGFNEMTPAELEEKFATFAMDIDDLLVCQKYFQAENREPNLTELKVMDTYWSDHCRHTTFTTEIDQIDIDAGPYELLFKTALNDYFTKRKELNRDDRPISLMDLGTIQAKYLMNAGILSNVEVSAEVNACALEIKVDVDGKEEDWILYFKNETHNHPTEIEPFGGASTCVGGGVRDPLSGRSWVYQAMRISGAKNPTLSLEETHPDKLPQRVISKRALEGNSDYANQIGVTGGFAEEIYHPGFEAKRLETGALISAAPRENIVREEPAAGDQIVLLGGRTGRDGLGAAVGSSQIQTEETLENVGAEVQKGAPAVERKIMRLFRNAEATKLIKRCNDFGAGGVSVAVGELADGLDINLDKVPVKYEGMHGGEIALSESQERMAVVVAAEDVEQFLAFAAEEDVESAVIAEVTDEKRMRMFWNDQLIIDLSREFLDSNGAVKHAKAQLVQPKEVFVNNVSTDSEWTEEALFDYMTDLNRANQQAMAEQFDGSIGRATVLFPYGGKNRSTQELGMVSRLPVPGGKTKTTSGMTYGFHPELAEQSPFHGAFYAVIESVSRMVALGFDYKDIRLTFQEFFETLKDDPKRWGKPVAALLGANLAMDGLQLGSIGGKDSMSGTYEELDVPPTLISFAVAQGHADELTSRAFKEVGSQVVLLENPLTEERIVDLAAQKEIYERVHTLIENGKVLAASTVGFNGMLKELIEMSYGNDISVNISSAFTDRLAEPMMGSLILEIPASEEPADLFTGIPNATLGITQTNNLTIDGNNYDIAAIQKASKEVFDSVFETVEMETKQTLALNDVPFTEKSKEANPKALVPVLFGTNGELDLQYALEAAGFEVTTLVIADSSHEKFEQSLQTFVEELKAHQVLALPNGAVYGNEPYEQGRAWELILNRPDVKEVIYEHLAQKRLIIGIGSSFSALVRTGLIEHGEITGESDIRILSNRNGKFISDVTSGTVISNASVFTGEALGERYTAPVATAFGRVDLGEAAEKIKDNKQVVAVFNEYHSEEAIDALVSPNGLVFGSVSSFDRVDEDLYKNAGELAQPTFLQAARQYFKA